MNKLLVILLILLSTFVLEAQTIEDSPWGPSAKSWVTTGVGSKTTREYIALNKIDTYTITLTDGGLGSTSIRTVVLRGTITSVKHNTVERIGFGVLSTPGKVYPLTTGSGTVTITVKWDTAGDGYFAFRQENDASCYDETYSAYYTKIIDNFNIIPAVVKLSAGSICSSEMTNPINPIKLEYTPIAGLTQAGSKCKIAVDASPLVDKVCTIVGGKLVFTFLPTDFAASYFTVAAGVSKTVTVKFTQIVDGNGIKIGNDRTETFIIIGNPTLNQIKHN